MVSPPSSKSHRGFTLVEILVVIAVIGLLAAILLPVFSQAREKARSSACLSNQKQIGTAVQIYTQDWDDRIFFYASTTRPSTSRTGAVIAAADKNAERWWNVLMPYLKAPNVFSCPGDSLPTMSSDPIGNLTIPRSYIACRAAEGLT
nr:type II secretion system GspH family protein [Armatimonadota bacterium]